jgi:hypothetical protein
MREGEMVKNHRVLLDGKNLEEEDFSIEVARSLGAFATTNLFSVDNLKERLRQRNQLIKQLRDQIRNAENNIKNEVSKGIKQARAKYRQDIQQLKSNLEEVQKTTQASQG